MKTVFITGGSRGIGKASVLAFLNAGWTVGFSYCHSERSALELQKAGKGKCFAFPCDLAETKEVERLAKDVSETLGIPDVLVNNAGTSAYGLFQDLSASVLMDLFQINFLSMYVLAGKLAPGMISRKSGRMINLASVWGEVGASCEVAYSASKAAVIGFTKALAKELAPSGISVNAVSPGVVDTDMMARFSNQEKEEIRKEIPFGLFTTPDEVASTILYLAQDAPSTLTGQIIGVNGCYG